MKLVSLFLLVMLMTSCELLVGPIIEPGNEKPRVDIVKPSDASRFFRGERVTLEVEASDTDGTISRVIFYVGGKDVATQTQPPYRYSFIADKVGDDRLAAVAYDDEGFSESDTVSISVDEAPAGTSVLNVDVEGPGTVSSSSLEADCSAECSATVSTGSRVTLRATPEAGATFSAWTGCASSATSCTLTVNGDTTVQAQFSAPSVGVSISPPSVSLGGGETQSFTADVTGSNEGVTWSTTGGALSTNGTTATYTAPGVKGTYEVTATSVTDPSKRATASVTVTSSRITEAFTIIALPDTQGYTCVGSDGDGCIGDSIFKDTFIAQTQWIVDNLETENIAFVTHEGDVVDVATRDIEWQHAEEAMSLLDGKVPYSVAVGDHDYWPEEHHDGDTSNYRKYYGASRYADYDWYGDDSPSRLSHYQLIPMGGVRFLHIALEWEAPSSAMNWAKGVIEAHPGVPTIITTHAYLTDGDDAGRSTRTEACVNLSNNTNCEDPGNDPDASSGQAMFEQLVEPYEQVFMVLNGHFHNNGRRSSCSAGIYACNNGEYKQADRNTAGSLVYQMLANYQSYDNGGDGWLRIIKFLPGGGNGLTAEGMGGPDRIKVTTYSPTLNAFQEGDASDFHFDLDFEERFGLN